MVPGVSIAVTTVLISGMCKRRQTVNEKDNIETQISYNIYKLDAESRELRDLESRGPDVASRA